LAVSGIYARLTATAAKLEVETTRRPVGEGAPYARVKEFKADLDVLDRSLIANNSSVIARGRLRQLRRLHLEGLLLRRHDALERRVARRVEAFVDGEHRRQWKFNDFLRALELSLGGSLPI